MHTSVTTNWMGLILGGAFAMAPGLVLAANSCLDGYPKRASEVMTDQAGTLTAMEKVALFSEPVYRLTLDSGETVMVRPGTHPLPPLGSRIELRLFFAERDNVPFATCYCRPDGRYCVEEYAAQR